MEILQQDLEKEVAIEFSTYLKNVLSDKEMKNVIELNKGENHMKICHSHDFVDANCYMGDAMQFIIERKHCLSLDEDEKLDIWNHAWDIAFNNDFFINPKQEG